MSRDGDERAEERPGGEEDDGGRDGAGEAGGSPPDEPATGEAVADESAAGEPSTRGADVDGSVADGRRGGDAAVDLPPVEELTGDVRRLDPRVRVIWIVRGGVTALVLGGLAAGVGVVFEPGFWIGAVLFTVAFALGVGHALAHYRRWRYEVRADALYLDRGVVTRVKTVVPHVRIQHVDVSRGPLERALGLSSVVVYTAGSRGADVTVPGLPPGRADDLQSRLKGLAIAAEGEDAV